MHGLAREVLVLWLEIVTEMGVINVMWRLIFRSFFYYIHLWYPIYTAANTEVFRWNFFCTYSEMFNNNKSVRSNLGRGPRRRESRRRGSLITMAKMVGGRRRVYYAALAFTDTVGQGFR